MDQSALPTVGDAYQAPGVRDVELSAPVGGISGGDRPTETEWLLVRLDGEPIGAVRVRVPAGGVTAEIVTAAIWAELSDEIVAAAGPAVTEEDLLGGLEPGGDPSPRADAVADRRADARANGPAITVVICTRDNPSGLRRGLESLLGLDYPRWRALVVDNAPSDDGPQRVVAEFAARAPVTYLLEPTPGLSRARNAAIAAAPGEILAFIDDDEIVDRHWLTEVASALLARPTADVITGVIVPAELTSPAQELFEEFGGHSKGRGFRPAVFGPDSWRRQHPLFPLPPFGTGANMVFTPRALALIGGFDPALGAGTPTYAGEDTHAFTRLLLRGGTIVYQPAAIARHRHREDIEGLRRQLYGYGVGLTAFYASLLRERPALIGRLIVLAPQALRAIVAPSSDRNRTLTSSFPNEVLRANLHGMLRGPFAYVRSRRVARPS
jgi:glycosyltransferase involved in cell wall biosynthesis